MRDRDPPPPGRGDSFAPHRNRTRQDRGRKRHARDGFNPWPIVLAGYPCVLAALVVGCAVMR